MNVILKSLIEDTVKPLIHAKKINVSIVPDVSYNKPFKALTMEKVEDGRRKKINQLTSVGTLKSTAN